MSSSIRHQNTACPSAGLLFSTGDYSSKMESGLLVKPLSVAHKQRWPQGASPRRKGSLRRQQPMLALGCRLFRSYLPHAVLQACPLQRPSLGLKVSPPGSRWHLPSPSSPLLSHFQIETSPVAHTDGPNGFLASQSSQPSAPWQQDRIQRGAPCSDGVGHGEQPKPGFERRPMQHINNALFAGRLIGKRHAASQDSRSTDNCWHDPIKAGFFSVSLFLIGHPMWDYGLGGSKAGMARFLWVMTHKTEAVGEPSPSYTDAAY